MSNGNVDVRIRCQRCGRQMELRDPAPGQPWPPQQFWQCAACGRNFWTTYPPPRKPKPQPAKTAAADAGQGSAPAAAPGGGSGGAKTAAADAGQGSAKAPSAA